MSQERIKVIFKELLLIAIVAGAIWGITNALVTASGGVFGKRLAVMSVLLVLGRYFYKSNKCYWINVGILLCGIYAVFVTRHICHLKIVRADLFNELHVWLSLIVLVIVLINLVNKKFYRGIMTLILSGSWLIMCFIYPLYYTAENSWFAGEAILAIMQSNPEESSSYLMGHVTLIGICILLLFLGILAALIYLNVKYGGIKRLPRKYYILLLAMVICSAADIAYMTTPAKYIQGKRYVTHSFDVARKKQAEYNKFKAMLANRNSMLEGLQVDGDEADGLYVLVIGESQTREHMSAYGYTVRDTTPWLKKMMDEGKAISFDNAYSCHTHTVQVLTYALTAKNQYNDRQVDSSASIIDVAKAAGYHTIWLSNQSHYGTFDTPISVIADSADEKLFVGEIKHLPDYHDAALIPQLDKISINGKTLLIVHLMGCHAAYTSRYPKEMAEFAGKDRNILYDNAVHYSDMVVEKIYEELSRRPDFRGMIFFSDHGEEPVKFEHNFGRFALCMTEIPMYMIFSPQYMEKYMDKYETLQKHRKEYFTNDLFYNTMLGILGIKENGSYEPWNDLSSWDYDGNIERFTTMYGEKHIKDIIQ